ncbi:ABC transporter ATP-binding protein [Aeromicrobium phragmitis]|uniref:ABC-type quaternary amine transporter n=1 Tax=Aeromicrobium phragmitis TaxID=2478914 RepID=A0A3L8PJ10_9ACTN|nr:ABC transporter ATP-binding protein [Aeromicrobium phragmitis]RLV54673.1 ABC transporter ATP-binding protein [Aeromicrobium phragmitis]
MNPSPDLDVTALTRYYDHHRQDPALDNISVTVAGGTTLAVLGPSGCGKSTLLRLLAGIEAPDEGRITLGDRDLSRTGWALDPDRRDVNMVFQSYALWPHLRVRDIIAYGLRHGRHRTSAAARDSRVEELVALLHLEGLEDRRPAELSGGQQQRVAIARALATRPSLLLFDEPLSNLDVQLRTLMRAELAHLLAGLDTTAVYVTHDVHEALALADQLLVLHSGRVVQHGAPAEVFAAPVSPWVAEMAGFSSSLAPTDVQPMSGGHARAIVASGALVGPHRMAEPGTADLVLVHPDAVRVHEDHLPLDGRLPALVSACVFEGRGYRILAEIPGAGMLTVLNRTPVSPGRKIGLEIASDGVLIFTSAA